MTPKDSNTEFNFDINEGTYDWCVKSFHALRNTLGVNLKVHHDLDLSEQGDIFLFNHFARFETIVPPYIIHKACGSYCRTVADHALFEGNERVSSFLRSVGAVPNTMPGLLPFLAAEILSGRKVVIFPEGGMVKDRRVMDDEGESIAPANKEWVNRILADGESSVLEKPISMLELSVRSKKCIDQRNIITIGELITHSEMELLGVKNFGQTSMNEIKVKLNDLGLSLKQVEKE